jgi:hypothetical protein
VMTRNSSLRMVWTYPKVSKQQLLPARMVAPPFGSTVTKTASMSSSVFGSSAFNSHRFLLTFSS